MIKQLNYYIKTDSVILQQILLFVGFAIIAAFSLDILSYGFSYPIIDLFGFRQAQTAITSYWFIDEGYKFNYITPILGPPWSIPFEFPIYQYIASFVQEVSGITLDQSGRLVSIIFFYVSAATLFFIMRALKLSVVQSLVPVVIFLGSPFYLFWARTFMIESTALAFGLLSILFFIKSIRNKNYVSTGFATIFGVLSALSKVTTFGICLTFISLMFLLFISEKRSGKINISYRQLLIAVVPVVLVPVAIAILWNNHADFLKSQNSLATFIISENLTKWNFGTIKEKLALTTWLAILNRGELITGSAGFVVLGLVSVMSKKVFWISFFAIVSFLTGPIVFTNLYVVHEYYFYANGLFLLIFMSGGIIALLEYRYIFASSLIVFTILIVMQYKYYDTYPVIIEQSQHAPYVKIGSAVKAETKKTDIIIIYGHDWNSAIPYYAERKAIMDRNFYPLENEEMQNSLNKLNKNSVGAVLLCDYMKSDLFDESFRRSRIDYFNLKDKPVRVELCDIYYRKD